MVIFLHHDITLSYGVNIEPANQRDTYIYVLMAREYMGLNKLAGDRVMAVDG